MNDKRERLIELIKERGIVFKHVKLSSNVESDYYYNLKSVVFNPIGASLLGDLLLEEVEKYNPKSVGGLESGAIPLAMAITMRDNDKKINSFFIRKQPKTHGLEKKIEGEIEAPIVVVDDVVTSGNSIMDAINAIKEANLNIKGVVCVIDREEKRIGNTLKQNGIKYSSLFRHSDFKSFIEERRKKESEEPRSSI